MRIRGSGGWQKGMERKKKDGEERQITHPPKVEVLVENLMILKLDVTGHLWLEERDRERKTQRGGGTETEWEDIILETMMTILLFFIITVNNWSWKPHVQKETILPVFFLPPHTPPQHTHTHTHTPPQLTHTHTHTNTHTHPSPVHTLCPLHSSGLLLVFTSLSVTISDSKT